MKPMIEAAVLQDIFGVFVFQIKRFPAELSGSLRFAHI